MSGKNILTRFRNKEAGAAVESVLLKYLFQSNGLPVAKSKHIFLL